MIFDAAGIRVCEANQFLQRSVKAALLSMLVFPGVGHLYLKRYIPGLLLSIGAATATVFILTSAVQTALEVVQMIQDGTVPPEAGSITVLVSQRSHADENSTNIAMIALFALWVIGILDAFRVGRTLEKAEAAAGKQQT